LAHELACRHPAAGGTENSRQLEDQQYSHLQAAQVAFVARRPHGGRSRAGPARAARAARPRVNTRIANIWPMNMNDEGDTAMGLGEPGPTHNRRVALVTGGSRGIGAATVLALARRSYDVALTYRNKASRAEGVVAQARALGADALAIGGDMTQPDDLARQIAELRGWRDRLDALILNASGGLERAAVAADPQYPWRINRDAQVALLDAALPLMPTGAVVVFVTSHWAYLYGQVEQVPVYEIVAQTKHAGEQAIRARLAADVERGIRLAIVTGDVIEGTITPRLIARATPTLTTDDTSGIGGALASGALPDADDMAAAIAAATEDATLPDGQVIVVGGALESIPRKHS